MPSHLITPTFIIICVFELILRLIHHRFQGDLERLFPGYTEAFASHFKWGLKLGYFSVVEGEHEQICERDESGYISTRSHSLTDENSTIVYGCDLVGQGPACLDGTVGNDYAPSYVDQRCGSSEDFAGIWEFPANVLYIMLVYFSYCLLGKNSHLFSPRHSSQLIPTSITYL